tara:strand:- start:206 stop:523 length:318 start_codon:yes stop_codon:yes gene_type:complete
VSPDGTTVAPLKKELACSPLSICVICKKADADTQAKPCGCKFHGACLNPSLRGAMKSYCPIDNLCINSIILCIEEDNGEEEKKGEREGEEGEDEIGDGDGETLSF